MTGRQVPPGGIALVQDGGTLVSVAGPGVAVCLWNEASQIACLAHFLEPATRDPARATARYGNVSVPLALRLMGEASVGGTIEAQLFGGAGRDPREEARSAECVAMARRILSARGVKVVSEDVGGSKGRKIVFQGSSGHVAVVKVHRLRAEDWDR